MSLPTLRRRVFGPSAVLLAAGVLSTALFVAPLPASAAPTPKSAFGAAAYGSALNTQTASSGYSSLVQVCTQNRSVAYSNKAAQTNLSDGLGNVGAVTTGAKATPTSSSSTSQTAGVRFLSGLISARSVTATANVRAGQRGTYAPSGSVVFQQLVVAGRPVAASPRANTVIDIPTVAKVTLNSQATSTSAGTTRVTVIALRVDVRRDDLLNRPAATILVGRATASAHVPTLSLAGGAAYSSSVDLAGLASSGPAFPAYLPCGGTKGAVVRNAGAAVSVPAVISTGQLTNTAQSIETKTKTTAIMQASITGVNLLNGVVSADAITARSTAARGTGKLTGSSTGSRIVGLKINGRPVATPTKPNTVIPIAGVGSLTVFKTGVGSNAHDVFGLELKLSSAQGAVPAGARIRVAAAIARVYPQS